MSNPVSASPEPSVCTMPSRLRRKHTHCTRIISTITNHAPSSSAVKWASMQRKSQLYAHLLLFPYHHTQRIKRVKKPKRLLWICTHMHMKQLVTKILIPGSQSPAIGMRTAQTPYRWTIGGQDYNWTIAEGELHLLIIPILSLGQCSQNLKIWNRPHKHSLPKCTPAIQEGSKGSCLC